MIEDVMQDEPSYHKRDMAVRDLNMRADPTNDQSPVIRRRFKPLNNPRTILELLQGIQIIKEGCVGQQHHDWPKPTNTLFGVDASQVQHNASSSSLREKLVLRPLPTCFKSNNVL
jgi:hypothetical protein